MDKDKIPPDWSKAAPLEAKYANCFRVGHNELEMMIDFAQCSAGEPVQPHTRIVTHEQYGKNLLEALRASLEE